MADRLGQGACVGVGRQSAWVTSVTRTAWFALVSCSMQHTVKRVVRETLAQSTSFNPRSTYVAEERAGGSLEIKMQYEGVGLWIEAALGATPSTTGPSSSLYTHVFTLGASLPTGGLSVEVQRGTGTSELFVGCKVNKATWKIEAGKEMSLALDLVARTAEARTTLVSPTWTVRRDYVPNHQEAGVFLWNSTNYTVDKLEVMVDNKLAARQSLGSALAAELPRSGFSEVSMTLELVWTADDFNNALVEGTTSDAVITFTAATPSGDTLTFNLNAAYVDNASDPINTAGVIKQTVKLIGLADASDEGLKITLVNGQSNPLAA